MTRLGEALVKIMVLTQSVELPKILQVGYGRKGFIPREVLLCLDLHQEREALTCLMAILLCRLGKSS